MNSISRIILGTLLFSVFLSACSKDDPVAPTTGFISGKVSNGTSTAALGSVRITLFNALNNNPIATFTTAADGNFRAELSPGSYYLRFARQGFEPVPPRDIPPLPVSVSAGATTDNSVQMFPSSVTNGGAISGKVTSSGSPVGGVLVVAESGSSSGSSLSDMNGDYVIFNLPPATYTVKAWVAGSQSTSPTSAVTAGIENSGVNLALSQNQTGTVSGHVSFLATTNIEVDVALLNPATHDVVPGLTTVTSGGNYSIPNVPYGTYLARATFRNDTKVMDPDWIVKNGEPGVTVAASTVTRDFSVTGAVSVTSPTNAASTTQPVSINLSGATFAWSPYSSTDNYVIEVSDQSGRVIWGGFANNWSVRKVMVPKTQTSIVFNSDSTATEQLTVGKVYRWRVYASKNDSQEPLGWKLISASEDQQGLFKIVP